MIIKYVIPKSLINNINIKSCNNEHQARNVLHFFFAQK